MPAGPAQGHRWRFAAGSARGPASRWVRCVLVLLLALGSICATPARAQIVRVQSGEHEGYTRLVLTLPGGGGTTWRLTRTAEGYGFDGGREGLRYDLSDVFRRIPRTRLTAAWVEPRSGRLHLGIGCRCHAAAFDLRPGIVVIDLKDGPAPAGSPFEVLADGAPAPPLLPIRPVRPPRRPAAIADLQPGARSSMPWAPRTVISARDQAGAASVPEAEAWRAAALAAARHSGGTGEPAPPDGSRLTASPPAEAPPFVAPAASGGVPADDLRRALYDGLGRAAARGVVDLVLPTSAEPASQEQGLPNLSIGGGGALSDSSRRPAALSASGQVCPPDAALDLAAWGDDAPVAMSLGPMRSGLTGEFDRADPAAAARAARYLLHIGFGAEARQVLDLAEPRLPEDALLRALAYLVDAEPPPEGLTRFAGLGDCDGAAALWLVLEAPGWSPGLRNPALVRSFSALPVHLRRHLGPTLAERLLAAGETAAARAVEAAVLRAPGTPDGSVGLMQHRLAMATGAAQPTALLPGAPPLSDLQRAGGVAGLRATELSLRRMLSADQVPDAATLLASEAMLAEFEGVPEAKALARTLAEGKALSGDFAGAFALAAGDGEALRAVWRRLADQGELGALLDHALAPPADILPAATERDIAARLIDHGFAREALAWLDPARRPGRAAGPDDLLLTAEALIGAGDGRAALRLLAGLEDARADEVRAEAEALVGLPVADPAPGTAEETDTEPGAPALAVTAPGTIPMAEIDRRKPAGPVVGAEQAAAAGRLSSRARRNAQWDILAATGDEPWRTAALRVRPDLPGRESAEGPVAPDGPVSLEAARNLVADSAAARSAISALLDATRLAPPPPGGPRP